MYKRPADQMLMVINRKFIHVIQFVCCARIFRVCTTNRKGIIWFFGLFSLVFIWTYLERKEKELTEREAKVDYFSSKIKTEVEVEFEVEKLLYKLDQIEERLRADIINSNIWRRVDDSVYTYSAYLDNRPRSHSSYSANSDANSSSSNLNRWGVIKIIGILRMPPKNSIMPQDWMRIKEESENFYNFNSNSNNGKVGVGYYCKIFVEDLQRNLLEFRGLKLTRNIFEEGLKIFAAVYYNCYPPNEIIQLYNNNQYKSLSVAIYPTYSNSPLGKSQIETKVKRKNKPDETLGRYPDKMIPVKVLKKKEKKFANKAPQPQIAVCVRPLFGPFSNLKKLVQFISYYNALGVWTFTFYNLSASPQIKDFLLRLKILGNFYSKSNNTTAPHLLRINLHEYNLPTGSNEELWDVGSLAALNDCVNYNYESAFVVVVDIDEFIVPQKDIETLADLIFKSSSSNSSQISEWRVRNVFFCDEFCEQYSTADSLDEFVRKKMKLKLNASESENESFILRKILSLRKKDSVGERKSYYKYKQNIYNNSYRNFPIFSCLFRTKRIWNVELRSKFILRPEDTFSVGHHRVTEFSRSRNKFDKLLNQQTQMQFNPDTALLYHFRNCQSLATRKGKDIPVLSRIAVKDNTISKFEKKMKITLPYLIWHKFFLI